MMSVVRPRIAASSPRCTYCSDSESSAEVASSSSSSGAFFNIARAIAMRWRWPPDRRTPRSPRWVRYPCGSRSMNSAASAATAAALTSSSLACGRP